MALKALTHPAFGPCEPVPNLLAIKWRAHLEEAQQSAALGKLDLEPAKEVPRPEVRPKDAPDPRAVHVNSSALLSFARLGRVTEAALKRIREAPEVEWVSQVFRATRASDGPLSYFAIDPTVLLVDPGVKDAALAAARAADAEATLDEERNRSLHGVAAIRLPAGNALELRDRIVASGAVPAGAIRFENIPYISPIAGCCGEGSSTHGQRGVDCAPAAAPAIPDDPLFGQQWGLARIDAPRAWPLTQGDPNVVVAVIDLGVELGHPDLHLWPVSYSTITHTNDGSPVGNHGTPCAGIISARTGNALGVAGLAGQCRVMAISTFFSDAQVAEGLYFAADNGARVVSMSFGVYPAWMVWDFAIIEAALQYCHERNMVLCAATGNENQPVSRFPATDPRTFGVGGSNRDDLRKSVGDTSIEGFWGACFGPDVDVVAPCLEIPATDRLGADGYTPGDYTLRFNGTSSATPHVAALAGLLFSLDPGLGAADVRRLIAETCDKIGAGTYVYAPTAGKPHGTWNNEVGYGRINAERALLAACHAGRKATTGRCGVELPRPEACCVSPCDPPWRPDSQCMYSYETRYFRVPAVKQDNVARRVANLPYIEFRVTYQHKLCLLGKQHGPLLFTVTLLPGERVTLYHSERYRRITSAQERFSVQTSFMQFLSLVHEARISDRLDLLAERLSSAKGTTSSTSGGGFFGGLFGFGGVSSASGSASVTDHTRVSLTHVAELFARSVMQASLLVEAERSLVVSTSEDKEQQDVSTRVIQNTNECRAVTYFVRRVMELYAASTMVSDVSFRIVGADLPDEWHGVEDIEWLPAPVRDLFRSVVRLLPRVGTVTRLPQPVTVPTDGAVYDPELAHCGSCEPQREAAVMLRLEQQKAEAMLACLKVREMELELQRRKMLLDKGELGAFAGAQPPAGLPG